MASADLGQQTQEMTFELNLVPFIDILSTCICFLLMTTVWIHVGMFDVSQAIGSQPASAEQAPSTMKVQLSESGEFKLFVEANGRQSTVSIPAARGGQVDWSRFERSLANIRQRWPGLKTALVFPHAGAAYADVIRVMDSLKLQKFSDVGLTPVR